MHLGKDNPIGFDFKVENLEWHNKPKPNTCLWLSSYNKRTYSDWVEWVYYEQDNWMTDTAWLCELVPLAKILMIDSLESYHEVVDQYLLPFNHPDAERYPYSLPNSLKFERMLADGYHGLHLTQSAQWATRFERYKNVRLYGWDCESTCLFTATMLKSTKQLIIEAKHFKLAFEEE